MPLSMARPMQIKGVYYFRQRVPRDLIPQVGRCWIKESLRTKNPAIARNRQSEVAAKYSAYWTHLRRHPIGIDKREATAIAGEVYRQFLEDQKDGARHIWAAHHWTWRKLHLEIATGMIDPPKDWPSKPVPDWDVLEKDAGEALRAVLQRSGIVVDDKQFKGLLFSSGKAVVHGIDKILRECDGDFSPDPEAEQFPPFVPPKDKEKRSPLAEDVWVAGAKNWSPSTREKYRRIFDDFLAQLPSYGLHQTRGDWDLARIAKDHVRAWRDGLLERLKNQATPRTIQREYLGALKAIFSSAVRGERIAENPADDVSVAEAWGKKGQKKRGFHDEEAKTILRAALAPPSPRMSAHRAAAQRWVPWLCAYTGARVNEMTQLRARDVVRADGVWCVSITPEAGTQKMESARLVPLHEHLIELGFVEFTTRFRPNQPLFHAYEIPELDDVPENAEALAEHRRKAADAAETIGGRLATWVRALGVTAKDVDPNHGWRHRFKTESRACAMDFNVLDAIQGHAPTSVSAKYGEFAPRIMAPHIAKLPRIVVDD